MKIICLVFVKNKEELEPDLCVINLHRLDVNNHFFMQRNTYYVPFFQQKTVENSKLSWKKVPNPDVL
jgi:hypothetical protein